MISRNIIIPALNFLSFVLTATGLAAFTTPQAEAVVGATLGPWLGIGLAAVASAITQLLIRWQWESVAIAGKHAAISTLLIAVIASGVSWLGGAAGAALVTAGLSIEAEKQAQQGLAIAEPLQDFANSFSVLRAEINELSQEAKGLASSEAAGGVTCRNDTVNEQLCGPRCRLRKRHAERLSELDQKAALLEKDARDVSVQFSMTSDHRGQLALYRKAAELQGNGEQPKISAALRTIAKELSGPVIDPEFGTTFTCKDPAFAATLEAIAAQANHRFELPSGAPEKQTVSISDTAPCVVKRVGSLFGISAPCDPAISDAPLIGAAILEILLVLLILNHVAKAKRLGHIPTEIEEFQKAAQARSFEEQERDRWYINAMATYGWDTWLDAKVIVVPLDGSVEAYREGEKLRRVHGELKLRYPALNIAELDPQWYAHRAERFGHPRAFNCYAWPEEAEDELRRAERDASTLAQP